MPSSHIFVYLLLVVNVIVYPFYRYDTLKDEWTLIGLSKGVNRLSSQRSVRSVLLGKDIVTTGGGNALCAEAFNTISETTTPGPTLNEARSGHALTTVIIPIHSPLPI